MYSKVLQSSFDGFNGYERIHLKFFTMFLPFCVQHTIESLQIQEVCGYYTLFLAILNYFILGYFWLCEAIVGYFWLLKVISLYVIIGYYKLYHHKLSVVILLVAIVGYFIGGY
jgi:hypothetical protein